MGMIDVGEKPVIYRVAEAAGKIVLGRESMQAIHQGTVKKGNPLVVAEVAAMNAAKQTHLLIPHCHSLLLDRVDVTFEWFEEGVEARCFVKAHGRTGVEMEALVGVSIALNTIWDMVKYIEKDSEGQYPVTRITDIRVLRKQKGESGD